MLPRIRVVALIPLVCFRLTAAEAAHSRTMEQLFQEVKKSPPELHVFLLRMPKGGDLHNHLSGAVYAESFLERAAAAPLCVTKSLTLADPVNDTCDNGTLPRSDLMQSGTLWNQLVDNLSMRGFVPTTFETGADHFFDSFGKFGAASKIDVGGEVAEVVSRAADQNESYMELMALSAPGAVSALGDRAGLDENNLDATRQKLMDGGLPGLISGIQQKLNALEEGRKKQLGCDSPNPKPACAVLVHYQYQVMRNSTKEEVFAQTLAGFMLADTDPRVVAVNYVQREDGYNSLHDYSVHMRMVAYAHKLYPKVHVALHAGELAEGLVRPEDLRFHIREAVLTGGAERVGHGIDIMDEIDSLETLRYMREHRVDVEINLTSNDVILGVSGARHPFTLYRKYGVPTTLSTDDEGVSRIDLTHEYERAVLTYGLAYEDLKQLARNSIEYSFATAEEKTRLRSDLDRRFREFERYALVSFK